MAICLIALGSNVGDRIANLERALAMLRADPGVVSLIGSDWFETPPIGGPSGQGQFVNAAARLETTHLPSELLAVLRRVEAECGRQRRERWAARVLDLDLLLYNDLVIATRSLEVPHPRMAFRRFVLEPASQVAGEMRHPLIGWTISELLRHMQRATPYVAVTGPPNVGKTEFVLRVCQNRPGDVEMEAILDSTAEDHGPASHSAPMTDTSRSRGKEAELTRLERRATQLLREHGSPGSPNRASDFWVRQSWAYAAAADANPQELNDAWSFWRDRIVPPKLLIMLKMPAAWWMENAVRIAPRDTADPLRWAERFRGELESLATQPGHGPFLLLDGADPPRCDVEFHAAIEAMR